MSGGSTGFRVPLDLRLVPAAVAAWAATAAALHASPRVTTWTAAVLGATALVVLAITRRRGRAAWSVLAVALLFAAGAGLGTAARVAARDASEVTAAAGREATVRLELVVTDDPRPIAGGFAGQGRVLVAARAEVLEMAGRRVAVDVAVVVLADADTWAGLLPSQRVLAGGRLLPPRGGDLTAAAFAARGPPTPLGGPSLLQRAAGQLRAGLVEAAAVLPPAPRGLLPGLVLGDTSGMDPVVVDQFRTTGLSHLVAVSGANCAIVVGAVVWLLRRLGLPRVALAGVAVLALAGFVVLVRPSPSVLRAAAMGAIALLALASGRPRTAVPALAAAVLVLVLVRPELAWSAGFALSVVATAGIVLAAPALTAALRQHRVPAGVAEALAVSTTASLATAPLIAALAGSVSLVAVPANLLAAPAVPPATVLGVLATLLSPLSAPAASGLAWLAGLPAGWLVLVAEHGSAVPGAAQPWPGGPVGGVLLAVALAGLGVVALRWPAGRRVLLACGCAIAVVVVPVQVVSPGWPPAGWLFVMCDVGQGDALVVAAGPGTAVVIDAGPEPVAVDRCLRRLEVRRIPLLVLSHLHADHVGGLAGVTGGRDIGRIEIGPQPEAMPAYADMTRIAAAAGTSVQLATVGSVRTVLGVEMTVLAPERAAAGTRSDPNNSSLVLRVRSGGVRLLLTGDVEVEAQRELLRAGVDVAADVLKVPHHGSAYQDEDFLDAVDASVALVSAGAGNDYGHPAPSLLTELAVLGMRVWRTDTQGALAVGTAADGSLWVAADTRPAAARPGARGPPAGDGSGRWPRRTSVPRWPACPPTRPPASRAWCWCTARRNCCAAARYPPWCGRRAPPTRTAMSGR